MTRETRLAAGGIVVKDNSILLCRYSDDNNSYLVAPGGAIEENEDISQAIIRETLEETGIVVNPKRVIVIENILTNNYKMIKVWMISEYIKGEIIRTDEAIKEGIIEVAWFTRAELQDEVVYPEQILTADWTQLLSSDWQVKCMQIRNANF